jgi:phosphoribosylamine--glycine ligase
VLSVTGLGDTPAQARGNAYAAAGKIQFDGKQMRRDIAERAVARVEEAMS